MSTAQRLAGALAMACLLTACSGGDDPSPAAAPSSAGGQPDAAGAGVDELSPADAIVEQTFAVPQDPQDKTTVGILALEVQGDVMQLRLAVTPDFTSQGDSDLVSLFSAVGQTTFGPTLVDVEHLKEYSVLTESSQSWRSTDLGTQSRNRTPMLAYAWYAAPEDDIDSIDVRVTDSWPAFTDVPITR